MLNCTHINATTLPDAWFQSVYKCLEIGRDFKIDRGSYAGEKRLEFDWFTVHIRQPWVTPMIPKLPTHYNLVDPVADDFIDQYLPYLMTGEEKEGESYTYGQRVCKCKLYNGQSSTWYHHDMLKILIQDKEIWNNPTIVIHEDGNVYLNQMELLIWTYKNRGFRNNQMIMQVGSPTDMTLQDPPCLRHIDTRIQDGALHFFPYFRSWDLWGGFPANLQALEMMKQYIAGQIDVDNGEIIATSKGLHMYKYVWEFGEILRGKTIDDFRKEALSSTSINPNYPF